MTLAEAFFAKTLMSPQSTSIPVDHSRKKDFGCPAVSPEFDESNQHGRGDAAPWTRDGILLREKDHLSIELGTWYTLCRLRRSHHHLERQLVCRPQRGVSVQDSAPFLKWAGGKQWLAEFLATAVPKVAGAYFEPFLGGGAAYFAIRPSKAALSDINKDLILAYRLVRDDPEAVIQRLRKWAFRSQADYYRVRDLRVRCDVSRAARFIYLNRTCWNGLYRVNRRGEFNVPCGAFQYPPDYVGAARIRAASAALQGVDLMSRDFQQATKSAGPGDVVYFDPPYTVAHGQNGFRKYNETIFSWSDQERLASEAFRLHRLGCYVIVSNAQHISIYRLYRKGPFTIRRIGRKSNIASDSERRRGIGEYLITNFKPAAVED